MPGYELFYRQVGAGHGGPYASLDEAIDSARRRIAGCVRLSAVDIRDRQLSPIASLNCGPYGPIVATVRRQGWQDRDPDAIVVEYAWRSKEEVAK